MFLKLMTPVVNLRAKKLTKPEEVVTAVPKQEAPKTPVIINAQPLVPAIDNIKTDDWDFVDEYDPAWPNEYEKLKEKQQSLKERNREERVDRDRDRDRERERDRDRSRRDDRKRGRGRNARNSDSPPVKFSGFGQRVTEEDGFSPPAAAANASKGVGVAIAPPPSLQEISIGNEADASSQVTIPYSASSVAAKIMAKYGFKDGQGLGKQEQGMSIALQVEKTSKRGGRIIHEKDVFLPPPALPAAGNSMAPPQPVPDDTEPSITEIMKEPSKVVLLRVSLAYYWNNIYIKTAFFFRIWLALAMLTRSWNLR